MKKTKLTLKKLIAGWLVLVVSILVIYSIAFAGSLFTSQGVDSEWYNSIKPSITPPDYVFPIVWNILFLLIAISFYIAWISTKNKKTRASIIGVFAINLLLNLSWSFLFFGLKMPDYAFVELVALEFSIMIMIAVVGKTSKISSILLLPYLVWVGFAGYLNYLIAFT